MISRKATVLSSVEASGLVRSLLVGRLSSLTKIHVSMACGEIPRSTCCTLETDTLDSQKSPQLYLYLVPGTATWYNRRHCECYY